MLIQRFNSALIEMADSTVVREDKIPGLSQTDCLTGKGSEDWLVGVE